MSNAYSPATSPASIICCTRSNASTLTRKVRRLVKLSRTIPALSAGPKSCTRPACALQAAQAKGRPAAGGISDKLCALEETDLFHRRRLQQRLPLLLRHPRPHELRRSGHERGLRLHHDAAEDAEGPHPRPCPRGVRLRPSGAAARGVRRLQESPRAYARRP